MIAKKAALAAISPAQQASGSPADLFSVWPKRLAPSSDRLGNAKRRPSRSASLANDPVRLDAVN